MIPDSLYEAESEKSFLGFVLLKGLSPGQTLGLAPEDFYLDLHKRVYKSIQELVDENIQIDPIALINVMKQKSRFDNEERELAYIYDLYRNTVAVQPLSYYSGRIKKLSERRKYLKALTDSIDFLKSEKDENNEYLFSKVERDLTDISRKEITRGLINIREDKDELIEYIKSLFESTDKVFGLKTHFSELDETTTGLKPHELMILAARPGNGKTTFALNIATNVAIKENKPVAIFSLEMGRQELLIKMICSIARINSKNVKQGDILKSDRERLLRAIIQITSAPVYIDDSGSLSVWEFKSKVRQLMITDPPGLIVVDYLQLMNDPATQRDGGRQQEVASISRALKQMAKEARCPIIALSQMSRAIEQRSKEQRPQLSDLRESGAIEQDADIVAFIYREDMVKQDVPEEKKNKAEIIIAKNRAGQTRSFELLFNPAYSRFDDFAGGE